MAKPPSDYKEHATLESDVTDFLEKNGYLCGAATYHTVFTQTIIQRLQTIYTPTALYIRGRADRLAVHQTHVFEYECKTHETSDPRYQDMMIEALPLVHRVAIAELGVRCLYCYRNPFAKNGGANCGFWISELPEIACIMIPPRWSADQIEMFESAFSQILPGRQVIRLNKNVKGSGVPLIKIAGDTVEKLPDWRTLIQDELTRYTQTPEPIYSAAVPTHHAQLAYSPSSQEDSPSPFYSQSDFWGERHHRNSKG